jgi:hypothetical protein
MTKAYLNALYEEGTRSDLLHWLVKLDAERDALHASLTHIAAVLSPGHRTLDDFIRDVGYACDEARRAIAKAQP